MRVAIVLIVPVTLAGCSIFAPDPLGHLNVEGTVTLDGAPAVAWRVFLDASNGSCPDCGPYPTDESGGFFAGVDIPEGDCFASWEVRIEPPTSLRGLVTPASATAPIACDADNHRDFAFASTEPP